MVSFSAGRNAKFVCSRCGFTEKYTRRKKELTGLIVCPDCYDGQFQITNHPQNFIPGPPPDGILKDPRPDAVMTVPASLSAGNRYR